MKTHLRSLLAIASACLATEVTSAQRGMFSASSSGMTFRIGGVPGVSTPGLPGGRRINYTPSGDPMNATFKDFPTGSRYHKTELFGAAAPLIEIDGMSSGNDALPILAPSPHKESDGAVVALGLEQDPVVSPYIWSVFTFTVDHKAHSMTQPHLALASNWPQSAGSEVMSYYFDNSILLPTAWYDQVLLEQSIRDDPALVDATEEQDIGALDMFMAMFDEFGYESNPWAKNTDQFIFSITNDCADTFRIGQLPGMGQEPFDTVSSVDITGGTIFRMRWDMGAWGDIEVIRSWSELGLTQREEVDAVMANVNPTQPTAIPTVVFSTDLVDADGLPAVRPQLLVHHASQLGLPTSGNPYELTTHYRDGTGNVTLDTVVSRLGINNANIDSACGEDPEPNVVNSMSATPLDPNDVSIHPPLLTPDVMLTLSRHRDRDEEFFEIHITDVAKFSAGSAWLFMDAGDITAQGATLAIDWPYDFIQVAPVLSFLDNTEVIRFQLDTVPGLSFVGLFQAAVVDGNGLRFSHGAFLDM